jgi:hypothetical protein
MNHKKVDSIVTILGDRMQFLLQYWSFPSKDATWMAEGKYMLNMT